MDVLKAMKNRLEVAADGVGGTDMEKKVKAATSLENWPATNTQLHELSQATNDYQYYKEIMSLLWKRLGEPPRNWRTIYKSLVLLEHLLRYGSPRVIEEARDRSFTLRQLHDFHFREPDTDKDRGSGIRDKSKQIVDLLADAKQLEEVRATAKQNLHKFVGVSNNGSVSGAGSMYGGNGHGSDGRYDDRGFGGGAGAFGASSGGSGYDEHVSRSDREKAAAAKAAFESRRSEAASASASSPYAEADADAGEKKKKKKKKKSEGEDGEDEPNPYEEAAPSSAKKKKKAAKAAKAAEADADEGADEEAEKKKAKKLKIKMRDAPVVSPGAPVALAAPPAAVGDDDGLGDFGNFTTATPAAAQPPQQQQQQQPSSSFDSFDAFGSSSGAPAPAAARPAAAAGGDLLDMFASASIDNSGSGGWGSSVARNNGPVDFLSAAPAQPQKQAAPSLFDAAVPVSKQKQQSQQTAAPKAELQLNDHNNADAFSSFVAGHKPAASAAPSKPAAAAAPKKSGELAWENNLVDLGSMASSKAPAGKMAPAPFIGGSSLDPFAGLGGAQQQQQRMAMQQQQQQQQQQQRPPQMGGAGMQGMGMGGGMMGMQGGMGMMGGGGMGMGMGMAGGQQMPMGGMGMGGMGMGMGMGMPGAGGMGPMGGMGGGPGFGNIGFTQQPDPNKIFF